MEVFNLNLPKEDIEFIIDNLTTTLINEKETLENLTSSNIEFNKKQEIILETKDYINNIARIIDGFYKVLTNE